MAIYDIGDVPQISAVFTYLLDGVVTPSDPDIVECIITDPSGVSTTFVFGTDLELVKDSTGNYHLNYLGIDASGLWTYRFDGHSSDVPPVPQGSSTGWFYVAGGIDLTHRAWVRDWIEIKATNEDDMIQAAIVAFSQYVINLTGRRSFTSIDTYTEVYDGSGSQKLFLKQWPITELVSVKVNNNAFPISTGYGVFGVAIINGGRAIGITSMPSTGRDFVATFGVSQDYSFSRGIANVQVVYKAGFPSVPADLEMAARETVAANYKRRQWIDLASKSLSTAGGSGTTSFRDWAMTPMSRSVIEYYSRKTY